MNTRDTENILAELNQKENYIQTHDASEADLIMINTCSIREKPVQKLFSEIGVYKKLKKSDAKIGVCGCTASHLGKDIIKRAPIVNFVLGARNVSKITEAVKEDKFVAVDITNDESEYEFASGERNSPYKTFINISSGCDKRCTYCIVPNTRGVEISIPPHIIVNEIKKEVSKGAKEVFLLGQNVNNYGQFTNLDIKMDFTDLLKMISEIDGVERIRFTSPHPLHMKEKFLQEFATNPKICKNMHMPLQSGSTSLLKSMKRGYSKEWFIKVASRLKELCPEVSISTDIIVGFPGESDEDFEDTIDVVNQVGFSQIFSFKYSPRPHTPAQNFDNQISDEVASSRLQRLQSLHIKMLDEIMQSKVGQTYRVYFDDLHNNGYIAGRTDDNTLIKIKSSDDSLLGDFADVKVFEAKRMVLIGELV